MSAIPSSARPWFALISFLSGAALMIVELAGNRYIAPVFGNSIYTWTALIGVVLFAYSAGSWLGGWLADRYPSPRLLAGLLLGAAGFSGVIPFIYSLVNDGIPQGSLIAGPFILCIFLFTIPGVLLGAISPVTTRLFSLAKDDKELGSSLGVMGMLGALGSFLGTVAAGFWLIPNFPARVVLMAVGAVLLLLALGTLWLVRPSATSAALQSLPAILALLVGGFASVPMDASVIHREDTFYHRISVLESSGKRLLMLDTTLEGGIDLDTRDVYSPYQLFWKLLENDSSFQPNRALFIGAGAFGMPLNFSKHYTQAQVDVAEIDPAVIEVGRKFFFLDESPQVKAHASDGRRFLKTSEGNYDFIFGDAYNGTRYIPPHLLSQEFFALVKEKLSEDGVYMMNVISAFSGEQAELCKAVIQTLKSVFPYVELIPVNPGTLSRADNLILMASEKPLDRFLDGKRSLSGTLADRMRRHKVDLSILDLSDVAVLTDDFNRVEGILARQLWISSNP